MQVFFCLHLYMYTNIYLRERILQQAVCFLFFTLTNEIYLLEILGLSSLTAKFELARVWCHVKPEIYKFTKHCFQFVIVFEATSGRVTRTAA